MRWRNLRVVVPLVALLPTLRVAASSQQVSFADHSPPPSADFSKTLINLLSEDPDYVSLLRLIQMARLVPTLNKLNNGTLFAPTNEAIDRHSAWAEALQSPILPEDDDNVHAELRQELLYHLLNYTLPDLPSEGDIAVEDTLHFPRIPLDPPTNDPPPYPPWMPIPGGSLGGAPQRLRLASRDNNSYVGVDASGQGGVEIVKPRAEAHNGFIYGLDNVLEVPHDLAYELAQHESLSYFRSLITPEINATLRSTPAATIFLPVNDAWRSLSDVERRYLESPFSTDDLNRILGMHAVVKNGVHWSDSFQPSLNLTSLDGMTLEVKVTDDGTIIRPSEYDVTAELSEPDIYASNGVIHTVSSLFFPPSALALTPEKYLLTFNCSRFVSLLHSANLAGLINSTDSNMTILAPSDEVFSLMQETDSLPDEGSLEMERLLKYHFIPGIWTEKNLKDGMLIETELKEVGLDNGRQPMHVEVTGGKKASESAFRFGGAAVIGHPIEASNTLIYFVSRTIEPPVDPLQAALPNIDLSAFLAAIFSTSLGDKLRRTPRTTFLLPTNDAFKRLGGLVSKHLLANSQSDLELVINHHVISGVEYSSSFLNGSQQSYPTLEGTDLRVERSKDGVFVLASGGWSGMKAQVEILNMLTRTGVVHQASDILLPRSMDLTVGKLVKAAEGSTMTSLVVKAGMDWVLNGSAPPEGSPWADAGLGANGWTLLCPTDDAFKGVNLTALYNLVNLADIVAQHVVPTPRESDEETSPESVAPLSNNKPLPFSDSATFSSLLSPTSAYGDLIFQRNDTEDARTAGQLLVGIKGARRTGGEEDWARVLSWGRSTTGKGTGGVIQIDRVLVPYRPPWWIEYGGPTAGGVVGLAAIGAFFFGVRAVWRRDSEATYEPIGGFAAEDSENA